jgi:hypothetical protein
MAEEKILEDMGRVLRAAWRRYLDIVEPIRPGLPSCFIRTPQSSASIAHAFVKFAPRTTLHHS